MSRVTWNDHKVAREQNESALDWPARVQRLESEVAGLRRAMRTRGLIEQAKGMLAERLGCDPEEAFAHLSRLSQETNVRLVDVAAEVLGTLPPPPDPQQSSTSTSSAVPTSPAPISPAPISPAPSSPAPSSVAPSSPAVSLAASGQASPGSAGSGALPVLVVDLPAAAPRRTASRPNGRQGGAREAAFRRATASISAADSFEELAASLHADGLKAMGGSAVMLVAVEPAGGLRLVAADGWPQQIQTDWRHTPSAVPTAVGRVVAKGRPLYLTGKTDPGVTLIGPGPARAVFPLRVGDRVVGAVGFIWDAPRQFADADKRYLQRLAGLTERTAAPLWGDAAPAQSTVADVLEAAYGPAQLLVPVRDDDGRVVDFIIEYANRAAIEMVGLRPTELLGRRLLDVQPYLATGDVFDEYVRVLETGEPFVSTSGPEIVILGGSRRVATIGRRAVRLGAGVLVTWRRLDEQIRRDQQVARMEALGAFGWADWDLVGQETYWSPGLFRILGRDPALGPIPLTGLRNLADRDPSPLHDLLDRLAEGETATGEFRVRTGDSSRQLRMVAQPRHDVPDGGGQPQLTGVLAVVQDVTDAREADQRLHRVQFQLAEQRLRLSSAQALAAQLREALAPETECLARVGRVRVAGRYVTPADGRFRGDFCDVAALPDGDVLIAIGDSFGSGIAAAETVARLLLPMRPLGVAGIMPADILRVLNEDLRRSDNPPLASAIVGRLDPGTGEVCWAQAGHLPPILIRGSSAQPLRRPAGPALGLVAGAEFAPSRLQLRTGDLLVWYTDGVAYHRDAPDLDPMPRLLRRLCQAWLTGGLAAVLDECGTPVADEACVLAVEMRGPEGSVEIGGDATPAEPSRAA